MREYDSIPMFCRRVSEPAMPDSGGSREALRAWLATRLREDLADPVWVDARRRDRITVMRGIEVRVNRRRHSIVARGRSGPGLDDWRYGRLSLTHLLYGTASARGWWWSVRDELPDALRAFGDEIPDSEMTAWISREARRTGLLLKARRKIFAALGLNPRLLALAHTLCRNGATNSDHYVMVWRFARESKTRVREAPLLWPLYDVVSLAPSCELAVVKRRLRDIGLTRGGWKVLCRHGRDLWWPARHCFEFTRSPYRVVPRLANLVAATGCPDLPPACLLRMLVRLDSMGTWPPHDACKRLLPLVAAWRRLAASIDPNERAAFLHGPLETVLARWMLADDPPVVPRGAGWVWFERRMGVECEALRVKDREWPRFGRRHTFEGVEVVPLRTLRAVRAAGIALRNCMSRAGEREDLEPSPLFLMRDAGGHELAMFSASASEGAAGLLEIRGRYNREPDSGLRAIACRYLDASRRCKLIKARRREPEFRCGTPFLERPPE